MMKSVSALASLERLQSSGLTDSEIQQEKSLREYMKPTPEQIKNARLAAQMTQKQAAETIGVNLATWQKYEYGISSMHSAFFELFLLKTGQKTLDCVGSSKGKQER